MSGKRTYSDAVEEYTFDELDDLYDEFSGFWDGYDVIGAGGYGRLTIEAQVSWNGSVMNKDNGMRRIHLDELKTSQLDQIREAFTGGGGWRAQLGALSDTQRRELGVSRTTLRRWERGSQRPSRANQGRISGAAKQSAERILTENLGTAYGDSVIQFRNIRGIWFE
jgi:hypothetical protein